MESPLISEISYEPASDTDDLTGDYGVVEADLDVMYDFGAELLLAATPVYALREKDIYDYCHAEKSLFGGDATWAQDLYDAWAAAIVWRRNEAWVAAYELQRLGEILISAAEDLGYTDDESSKDLDELAEVPDPNKLALNGAGKGS